MVRNPRVLAFDHLFVQALHVVGPEGWVQGAHFVENAAQRPNVTFGVVGHIPPDFRTGVVRGTRLCITQPLLHDFGHI